LQQTRAGRGCFVDGFQSKGSHSVTWNEHNQPGGLYIYQIEVDGFTTAKKIFV